MPGGSAEETPQIRSERLPALCGLPWLEATGPKAMNTQHCQTCSYWDQNHSLEPTPLGPLAPCTRHAPTHFRLERINLASASRAFLADSQSELQVPVAVWPYTNRNQICGDYQPCDLEEGARRNKLRTAPLP